MTNQTQNNLEIATARYLQSPSNSSIKNIQLSPCLSAAKRQMIALIIEKRLKQQRLLQQYGANKDGATKQYGRKRVTNKIGPAKQITNKSCKSKPASADPEVMVI